jgi:predicted small secreted protein
MSTMSTTMKKSSLLPTLVAALALALGSTGCNAIVRGAPLSSVPHDNHGVFLTTSGSPVKYKTLGFVQIRGYGVAVAGLAEVGDAQLTGTIRGTLAVEATKMGGTGVINIEFEDENPQNDLDKANDAYNSFRRGGSIQTKDRYVTVTGEVVQFLSTLPVQSAPAAAPQAAPPPVAPATPTTPGTPAPPQGTPVTH